MKQGDSCGDRGIQAVHIVVYGNVHEVVTTFFDVEAYAFGFISDDEGCFGGPIEGEDIGGAFGIEAVDPEMGVFELFDGLAEVVGFNDGDFEDGSGAGAHDAVVYQGAFACGEYDGCCA